MSKPILCFLIDDDPDDQEIFQMVLMEVDKNATCIVAGDGAEAMAMLNADVTLIPDYIFIDVNMPKMNGIECLQEIRKLSRLAKSEVIMYSTTLEKKMIDKSVELGAGEFIVKPSEFSLIVKAISKALSKGRK